ncbi:MAG: hypothetical protein ABL933_08420 [Methyloglobulus sp.]
MKKSCFYLLCSLLMLVSSVSMAANRAVEISIGGIGPGVDQAALQTVRQAIGFGVGQGIVDKFIVNEFARPIEGGFTGCVQASPYTKQFGAFVKQLKAIKANPLTSFYNVRWIATCTDYKPYPPDDQIMCTMEVKQCPNGSYVGRTGPRCEFAPCPK